MAAVWKEATISDKKNILSHNIVLVEGTYEACVRFVTEFVVFHPRPARCFFISYQEDIQKVIKNNYMVLMPKPAFSTTMN